MGYSACLELESKVIKRDLCTLCGACVGICPYVVAHRGRVLVRDLCDLEEGRCTAYCPRISLDLDGLSREVFGRPYAWEGIGTASAVFMARATDAGARARAQDAGTVGALTRFALREGIIDSWVATFFEDKSFPEARAVSDVDELAASAGSNYMATHVVAAFNRRVRDPDAKRVGVVATPCQALALAGMKGPRPDQPGVIDRCGLVVGLFCTWALSYPAFAEFLAREAAGPILKYKIPPPPARVLQVFTATGVKNLPLDLVMPYVRPACTVCHDMTSEFADVSVGAVEFEDAPAAEGRREGSPWNTVIVRTERGMELVEGARSKGVIEMGQLPRRILDHLKKAAAIKKKRALGNIVERTGARDDLLYFSRATAPPGTMLDE